MASSSEKRRGLNPGPLEGKCIWITREVERAIPFDTALRELGAETLVAATTKIEFFQGEAQKSLARDLGNTNWDWILFSSANAVIACGEALHSSHLSIGALGRGKIAVVGPGTKAALEALGVVADLVSDGGDGSTLAEHLITRLAGQPARILLPRAKGGRLEAERLLRAAGCQVHVVDVYQSVACAADEPSLSAALDALRGHSLQVVVLFAPSQVEALCSFGGDVLDALRTHTLVAAIGATTAASIAGHGLCAGAIAVTPTPRAMAEAIREAFARLSLGSAPT